MRQPVRIGLSLLAVVLMSSSLPPRLASQPATPPLPAGATATLLADGRWLHLGGHGPRGPLTTAGLWDPVTQTLTPLAPHLQDARTGHTATVLADGTVLIVGGIGDDGRVVSSAESFDPQAQTFDARASGPSPRAFHSATLLTDGRLLLAGGLGADGMPETTAELWDARTQASEIVTSGLASARLGHAARLQADGTVVIDGGVDSGGAPVAGAEVYEPERGRFSAVQSASPPPVETAPALRLRFSDPVDGAVDVPIHPLVALRFSAPLEVTSVSGTTVALIGPQGPESATVTPAEGGLLVFVSPKADLVPAAGYRLVVDGAMSRDGRPLAFTSIRFRTTPAARAAGEGAEGSRPSDRSDPGAEGDREPRPESPDGVDEWEWRGERRNGRPYSPWQALPPLQAPAGVTALAGQVLRLDGAPLARVTLTVDGAGPGVVEALTDDTGRFLLAGVRTGRAKLLIDGRTASARGLTYGLFAVAVEIAPGTTTALAYTIWMPRIDTVHAVTIPAYTSTQVKVTTPRIPGLELWLPSHAGVRDHEGRPATEISITPIPPDRPPFPLPQGVETPAYFTVQPGEGYVYGASGQGARLVYPNFSGRRQALAGTRFNFWSYDPDAKGWHVYGLGTVAEDGLQVHPDPKVEIYEFTGAMAQLLDPGASPHGPYGADPVDLATGMFVLRQTDLVLPDIVPVVLRRTYRSGDTISRAFGVGGNHPYDIFLVGTSNPWTYLDLILEDGTRLHYPRVSPGTRWTDAVYEHASSPTPFYKSRISWNETHQGWDLRLKDGTVYEFPESGGAPRSQWAALKGVRDRYGNALTLTRDTARNLTRITTPTGRWVDFSYDAGYRITQATDSIGRTVTYGYDGTGRLTTVTDAGGGVTTHAYNASNWMTAITDPRGITYLTNEYDSTGKVVRQTQPGGIVWQLAYALGAGGIVTQTDLTDPNGVVRRVTFDGEHRVLTDTAAAGTALAQTTSYEWQAETNLLLAAVDALGRRTAYAYDALGNTTTVTAIAGTGEAVTTTFTYEPTFGQVASVADPLGHATTFSYDAAGNVTAITDPLGHQTTVTYTALGQPQTITTAAGTTQLAYDVGDLVSITDPLGRTTRRFTDAVGRLAVVTDPRGNQTRYEYDVLNALTKIVDALSGQTQFGYDPSGNLLSVTDARGNVTSYGYDGLDRVATRTDPLGRQETYAYDLNGNLTQVIDRRGNVTAFGYDGLNRLTFAGFGKTAPSTYESSIGYGYDAGDRLRTVTDSLNGTLTLTYDSLDRLIQEVTPQGTVSYGYDAASRRSAMTVLGQPQLTYSWDGADRLTQIARGTATVGFDHDAAGRRTKLALPNGVTVDHGWDPASQLTGLTYRKGATTLGTLTYGYDAAGNRRQVGGTWARTGLPEAVASASYDAANRQLALGGRTMTYDLAGNLTTLVEPAGTTTFTWDARGQLTAMTTPEGPASFQYDALGRRRSKTVSGTQTGFFYDGLQIVQELSAGSVTANVLAGLGLDEHVSRTTPAGTRTLLTDALGSTVALTDDAGAVQTEYTYEPYGASTETGADDSSLQYTGRENDLTGLYYYRARYYHPGLQRFISEDPIEFAAGDVNLYAYVGNSPLVFVDQLGLEKCLGDRYGRAAAYWYASRQAETGRWYYAIGGVSASLWMPESCRRTASWLVAGSASALYLARPFWQYFPAGNAAYSSRWLTSGWGWVPPLALGEPARRALSLPQHNPGTAVRPVKVPWWRFVGGPGPVSPRHGQPGGWWQWYIGGWPH